MSIINFPVLLVHNRSQLSCVVDRPARHESISGRSTMKTSILKTLIAISLCLALSPASAQQSNEVKIGVLLGFTGPIESLAAPMKTVINIAAEEVSDSGLFLNGARVVPIFADTTCADAGLAVASAERAVAEGISGIIGGACSGATAAMLTNVATPRGMVMISPGASSPSLNDLDERDLFFRTVASDLREGQVMAEILRDRGVQSIAITYTNNDFGKGLSEAVRSSFTDMGGDVTIVASHEDGKADYTSDVATLAAAGGDVLVVVGYIDQGGLGVVRAALDLGAFEVFGLASTMIGDRLLEGVGPRIEGSFGQVAGTESQGLSLLADWMGDRIDGRLPYVAEVYDAMAIMVLAMQAAGTNDSTEYVSKIWEVANAPGEKIYPGQLAKGLELLAAGHEIDYVGGSAVELIGGGESAGAYREVEIRDGEFATVRFR
ncbi:ABC transporter substrate-binding protein [Shimia sp. SDUM112013]|uniref:ABC transporter substrate-binding protein n=1 Tax=Shimia sp. SDUM112013 TaxID=3136160 RepID=UPI0032EBD4A6